MSRKYHPKASSRPIYGNIEVYSNEPDSRLMFRTSRKRAQWYLDRGLAKTLQWDNEPGIKSGWLAIRLTFTPNGMGSAGDDYYLQVHRNQCCVCGAEHDLVHNHVVPSAFRRYFPPELKDFSHHDVLPICLDCKKSYEPKLSALMREFAAQYGYPENGVFEDSGYYAEQLEAKKAACALIGKHKDQIPQARKYELLTRVHTVFDSIRLDESGLRWVASLPSPAVTPVGALVVRSISEAVPDGPDASRRRSEALLRHVALVFRQHFVTTLKPQYLPNGWDICRMVP